MDSKKQNGGARAGAGRPPKIADAPAVASFSLKLTEAQKSKVRRLGGADWVRQMIEQAKEPSKE